MMERMTLTDRAPPKESQGGPHIKNPNFRRNQPQIKQREPRNPTDQQQIRPPFQENYAKEENETADELEENQSNLFCEGEINNVFLTKEEQDLFLLAQQDVMSIESEDYKMGYQNAIMEVHKQYNLRNKKVAANPPKKIQIDTPSTSQTKVDPQKETPSKTRYNSERGRKASTFFQY